VALGEEVKGPRLIKGSSQFRVRDVRKQDCLSGVCHDGEAFIGLALE